MTINQQPKVAMHAVTSSADPGASSVALRAPCNAPGPAAPGLPPGADSEVVARARRRVFSNADKRRILEAADRCTKAGEVGALMRREGVYSSLLSTWRRQREAAELAALAPARRGPKADPHRAETLQYCPVHARAQRPQEPPGQGPAGHRRPKKTCSLAGQLDQP